MSPLDRRGDEHFRYAKNLGHMRLYLDDLDDIVHHLRLSAKRVLVTAGNAYAENGPSDLLSARKSEMRNVRIFSEDPDIEVELRYGRARVGTNARSAAAKKLVDSVALLLSPRRRTYIADTKAWLIDLLVVVQLVTLVPFVVSEVISNGYYPGSLYTVTLALMISVRAIISASRSIRIGRVIVVPQTLADRNTKKRQSRSSSLQQILIVLLGAIVSAALPVILLALNLSGGNK
ncbi:hypothetical protein AB0B11_28580 [Micromonospora tulbaghiae]|uniref:hypothetical protein n=1 Tax=Micromonospora tulbaghiae TaxID=479978 RepID=UPI0033D1777D